MLSTVYTPLQAYLWEDNRVVVEWLAEQLDPEKEATSTLRDNIRIVTRDHALHQIKRCASRRTHVCRVHAITQHQRGPLKLRSCSTDTGTKAKF